MRLSLVLGRLASSKSFMLGGWWSQKGLKQRGQTFVELICIDLMLGEQCPSQRQICGNLARNASLQTQVVPCMCSYVWLKLFVSYLLFVVRERENLGHYCLVCFLGRALLQGGGEELEVPPGALEVAPPPLIYAPLHPVPEPMWAPTRWACNYVASSCLACWKRTGEFEAFINTIPEVFLDPAKNVTKVQISEPLSVPALLEHCDPRDPPNRGQNWKIRKMTFLGSKSAFFGGVLSEPFKWAFWGI